MPVYFLAVAVAVAAAAGLVMNRDKRFHATFDGAALLLIGAVFGFLLASILVRPSAIPPLAGLAPQGTVAAQPDAAQPAAAGAPAAEPAATPPAGMTVAPRNPPPPPARGPADTGGIDVFVPANEPSQRNLSLSVTRSTFLMIEGWAFDTAAKRPPDVVLIGIDGTRFYRATSGLSRPDVAQAYSEIYRATGFHAVIPTARLTPGHHEIRVVTSDGRAQHALPPALALEIQ